MLKAKEQSFSNLKIGLIYLMIVVIAYWPVTFLAFSLKWDMIDVVLPYRYFAGECLQNGIFPLWNPYQQMGYPFYADMQVPLWNPEIWIIGFLFGYSNYTLHFLFLFYLLVAGWGVFRLSFYSGAKKENAFLAGAVFMLSGFFTGHGQAMFSIVAAAWTPYVLLFYLKLLDSKKIKYSIPSAIFMYLLISNGYQTFTIILSYFLLFITLVKILENYALKDFKGIGIIFMGNLIFAFLTALLCLPTIVSLLQSSPFTDRSQGLPLESALLHPLSPRSLLSLLVPFATVKNPDFFKTDMSMANAYFGVIMLAFSLMLFFRKKPVFHWALLFFAFLALIASFGEYTPLRAFLYHHLPLMNLFRFPSYFSYFTILLIIVLTAVHFPDLNNLQKENRFFLIVSFSFILMLLFILLVYSSLKLDFDHISFFNSNDGFFKILQASSFMEHVFFQSFIHILFIIPVVVWIVFRFNKAERIIPILIIAEMCLAVQFNLFYTVVSHKKPVELHANIKKLPQAFPLPEGKISDYSEAEGIFLPVWRNTGIFSKKISHEGFSSFWLTSYFDLFDDHPEFAALCLQNNILYLSDQVRNAKNLPDHFTDSSSRTDVYLNKTDYELLASDSLKMSSKDQIVITSFSPVQISAKIHTAHPLLLVFLQSSFPGWKLKVDGNNTRIMNANILFMAAYLDKGKHIVTFTYENRTIIYAFIISSSFLFIFLLYLIFRKRK